MDIYSLVKKYIDEYDFEDLLAIGAPNDEYDSESREIASLIIEESTTDEIAEIISDVMKKSFGELIKVDVSKSESFMEIAGKIHVALGGCHLYSRVILEDGTVGTIVDRMGPDYVIDIGHDSSDWYTICVSKEKIKLETE